MTFQVSNDGNGACGKLIPTDQEEELLRQLRQTGWGEGNVILRNGAPVRVELKKTVQLDVPLKAK